MDWIIQNFNAILPNGYVMIDFQDVSKKVHITFPHKTDGYIKDGVMSFKSSLTLDEAKAIDQRYFVTLTDALSHLLNQMNGCKKIGIGSRRHLMNTPDCGSIGIRYGDVDIYPRFSLSEEQKTLISRIGLTKLFRVPLIASGIFDGKFISLFDHEIVIHTATHPLLEIEKSARITNIDIPFLKVKPKNEDALKLFCGFDPSILPLNKCWITGSCMQLCFNDLTERCGTVIKRYYSPYRTECVSIQEQDVSTEECVINEDEHCTISNTDGLYYFNLLVGDDIDIYVEKAEDIDDIATSIYDATGYDYNIMPVHDGIILRPSNNDLYWKNVRVIHISNRHPVMRKQPNRAYYNSNGYFISMSAFSSRTVDIPITKKLEDYLILELRGYNIRGTPRYSEFKTNNIIKTRTSLIPFYFINH